MKSGGGALSARLGAALTLALLVASGQGGATTVDSMAVGSQTSQPIGHYEFCKVNPAECSVRPADTALLRMTDDVWSLVTAVNFDVNNAIKPVSDIDNYGVDEIWIYPDNGKGDCEDYVLEKRRQLHAQGISLANLLITVVRKPDGEGHAVLSVRSDRGDFILDNLTDSVKLWRETGYKYLKRQASYHTGRWVSLIEDNPTLVGSLR